jgi:tRNA dimethylallyltransferase
MSATQTSGITLRSGFLGRPEGCRVLVVAGPTACGKTDLCHALADVHLAAGQRVVLVNLDAFQFVRGFDVGTAKPSREERLRYDYRMIDVCSPEEMTDAQAYGVLAREIIQAETARGSFVMTVGGSGLYMRSLLHGLDELPQRDETLREFLRDVARYQGSSVLHRWLQRLDPLRAKSVHANDVVRLERALEIFFLSGRSTTDQVSRMAQPKAQPRILDAHVVALLREPDDMARRIAARTQALVGTEFDGPWILEVRRLRSTFGDHFFDLPAARAIGYVEIARDLQLVSGGVLTTAQRASLCHRITVSTRRYAKKQRTWLASAAVDDVLVNDGDVARFVSQWTP